MWRDKGLVCSALLPPESDENMDQIERDRERVKREEGALDFTASHSFLQDLHFIPAFWKFSSPRSFPQWLSRPSSSGCVDANTQVSALASGTAIMTALLENYRSTTREWLRKWRILLCEQGTCMRSLGPCKSWKQNWLHKFVLWSLCVQQHKHVPLSPGSHTHR